MSKRKTYRWELRLWHDEDSQWRCWPCRSRREAMNVLTKHGKSRKWTLWEGEGSIYDPKTLQDEGQDS